MLLSARSNSRILPAQLFLAVLQVVALAPQFLLHLLLRHAVDERGAERRQHDEHGTAGNRQRHGGVIDPARNHDHGRIVLHADGTHGREVHEADGKRQQCWRDPPGVWARQALECHHGRRAQSHAAHACSRAQPEIPLHFARHDQGLHADEMHGGDARTDDRAAHDGVPVARPGRDPKSQAGDDHGDDQRHDRRQWRVGHGHARAIGQHGHKMRGPDARTGADPGQRQPTQAAQLVTRLPRAVGDMRIDVERRHGRHGADAGRQQDEPPVVLSNA